MFSLPSLMLAPNGARRTQADHPALPMTIPDIVQCAKDCHALGVDGLHAHVRDQQGRHVLDIGLYRTLLQELAVQVPTLRVQVTSEAAGRYQAAEQQAIMRALKPSYLSVAWREMLPDTTPATRQAAQAFYHWAADQAVMLQHILYSAADVSAWLQALETGLVPRQARPHALFVLGRYAIDQQSDPNDLHAFLHVLDQQHRRSEVDWAVCAFGVSETACLLAAVGQGGKIRLGFENSLWHADGSIAKDNADRVRAVQQALQAQYLNSP